MIDMQSAVLNADKRIRSLIKETPLDYSVTLSKASGAEVYLKCENLQQTGAFKARGALNKLIGLSVTERERGVVTASSGNHGAAIAYGLNKLKINGKIFVPENVSSAKLDNIRNYTKAVELYGTDCVETELHALAYAKQHGMVYVSPYNDAEVISGQGTIALELTQQLKDIAAVFVPIGGGGLIAGIAGFMKSVSPQTKIIGCMPVNSPVMAASIEAGNIIEMDTLPTLSDATAGGIEPAAITFALCQQWVDDYVLITEDEIKAAILELIKSHRLLVEGASGVALAACLKSAAHYRGKNVVVILSGGNISFELLRTLLA